MVCSFGMFNTKVYASASAGQTTENIITGDQMLGNNMDENTINDLLLNIGTPEEVLNEYTLEEKTFIWENIKNDNPTFISFENKEEIVEENNKLRNVSNPNELKEKLKFTVTAFKTTKNGQSCVAIYPSFNWLINDDVKNDYFGFALADGWEAIPNIDFVLKLFAYNGNNQVTNIIQYNSPSDISTYGAGYKILDGGFSLPNGGHFRGMAVYYARKKDSRASNLIAFNYTHDNALFFSPTYGVTIGPASICVSSNHNNAVSIGSLLSFNYK